MTYRKRSKYSKKLQNMRKAKERVRAGSPTPNYPAILPDLRREVIIIDHDFGTVTHHIQLFKTGRVDCYRAVADGKLWKERIGWSRVLEGLRKSMPRVGASM